MSPKCDIRILVDLESGQLGCWLHPSKTSKKSSALASYMVCTFTVAVVKWAEPLFRRVKGGGESLKDRYRPIEQQQAV